MKPMPPLRSPLKHARGLGSAHTGTHHFWVQRATAVALVPLTLWFMRAFASHVAGSGASSVASWLKSPFVALALAAMLLAGITHARMGVQVIIEDYVAKEGTKIVLLLLLNAIAFVLMAMSLMAIAKLHFIGA